MGGDFGESWGVAGGVVKFWTTEFSLRIGFV